MGDTEPVTADRWMTPGEAAGILGVTPRTVVRWAEAGVLDHMRTVGGHRRFRHSVILAHRDRDRADRG